MTLRLSTGLRNAILDTKSEVTNIATAATRAFEDGTGTDSRDRIVDASEDLSVYAKRGNITVLGSTSNDGTYEIIESAAGYIEVAAGSLTTEALGDDVTLADASGGSYVDLFRNCVIDIYSGTQPSDADSAETGTKLVSVTLSSGAFVADAAGNGLNFGAVAAGVLAKETGETWSGVGLDDGTAGWFRIYDNAYVTGASSSEIRMDGAVATSGSQFNMSSTSVVTGATTTVDSMALTQPAA